jgi:hypothetical protein
MMPSAIPYLSGGTVPVSFNTLNLFGATGSNVGQDKSKTKLGGKNQQDQVSDFSFQDRVSQVKVRFLYGVCLT